MIIRIIANDNLAEAIRLVTDVFMEFEAPDYSEEGIRTFFVTALNNAEYMNSLTVYGAYINESLVGVLATRNKGSHIALFFVDGAHQGKGIGRNLFNAALENCTTNEITVNSSPFARAIYSHLGFLAVDVEQIVTGIRFIPMIYRRR